MSIAQEIQEHEEVGMAKFWQGEPVSACRSLAMRRGWEMAHEAAREDTREEQVFWLLEAAESAVRA